LKVLNVFSPLIKTAFRNLIQTALECHFILVSGLVYTMQEIGPRSWTERGLTNRIDRVTELFKYDWLILSPFKILDQFLASYTQGLTFESLYGCIQKRNRSVREIWLAHIF